MAPQAMATPAVSPLMMHAELCEKDLRNERNDLLCRERIWEPCCQNAGPCSRFCFCEGCACEMCTGWSAKGLMTVGTTTDLATLMTERRKRMAHALAWKIVLVRKRQPIGAIEAAWVRNRFARWWVWRWRLRRMERAWAARHTAIVPMETILQAEAAGPAEPLDAERIVLEVKLEANLEARSAVKVGSAVKARKSRIRKDAFCMLDDAERAIANARKSGKRNARKLKSARSGSRSQVTSPSSSVVMVES